MVVSSASAPLQRHNTTFPYQVRCRDSASSATPRFRTKCDTSVQCRMRCHNSAPSTMRFRTKCDASIQHSTAFGHTPITDGMRQQLLQLSAPPFRTLLHEEYTYFWAVTRDLLPCPDTRISVCLVQLVFSFCAVGLKPRLFVAQSEK